jgi:hypothetical protein
MPSKTPLSKFAQTIPIGTVAMICGISGINLLSQNLVVACLLGTLGVIIGIATLKIHAEKLDKIFAMIGIILSLIPMIYAVVSLVKK